MLIEKWTWKKAELFHCLLMKVILNSTREKIQSVP